MIFPTLAVVVGSLLVVGDAAAVDGSFVKEITAKALNGKVYPDAFAKKANGNVRKAAVPASTTYTDDGWLVQTFYTGGNCNEASASEGYAADTCFQANGGSMKYQLTGSTCVGAVVQTFTDTACANLDTTEDLDIDNSCVSVGSSLSYKATCTSSTSPSIPYQAVTTMYFQDTSCDDGTSLAAVPANTCYGTAKYTCSGSNVNSVSYSDDDCSGTATTVPISSTMCFDTTPNPTVDDDYSPGEAATNFELMCTGSASSLAGSLGAKAALAVVLGAVAYLAF